MAAAGEHGGHQGPVFGLGADAFLAVGAAGAGDVGAAGEHAGQVRMLAVHAAVNHGDFDPGALGNLPGFGDAGLGEPVFLVPPGVGVGGGAARGAVSAAAEMPPARAKAINAEAVRRRRAVALVIQVLSADAPAAQALCRYTAAGARLLVRNQLMLRAIPSRISCSLAHGRGDAAGR